MKLVPALAVWRHPKPHGAQGRCIGRTDLAIDRRKAKRLAHRIRQWARSRNAARIVVTSDRQRSHAVGRCLARWGWQHLVDPRLNELDFGRWDGLAWARIGAIPVEAWCSDFAAHAPGGGETVSALLGRCAAFLAAPGGPATLCVVGHAGWISAARWLASEASRLPTAAEWPAATRYAELTLIE